MDTLAFQHLLHLFPLPRSIPSYRHAAIALIVRLMSHSWRLGDGSVRLFSPVYGFIIGDDSYTLVANGDLGGLDSVVAKWLKGSDLCLCIL